MGIHLYCTYIVGLAKYGGTNILFCIVQRHIAQYVAVLNCQCMGFGERYGCMHLELISEVESK